MGDCRQRGRYEIAVLREPTGRGGSEAMHRDCQVGSILHCNPPVNHFELVEHATNYILIAGGIGITPIRTMAIELQRRGAPFMLHYATRTADETVLKQDIADQFGANVMFWHSIDGARLDVQAVMSGISTGGAVYVCGPASLIQAAIDALDPLGLPRSILHFETFTAAAPNTSDHAFEVVLKRSAQTVRVRPDQTILDAVLAAGIDAPFGCRAGECGVCAVGVLGGEPDHPDTVLDESNRAVPGHLCICFSRARNGSLVIDL